MTADPSKSFAQIAIEEGFVTAEQVADAVAVQEGMAGMGVQKRIEDVLRYKGYMNRSQISHVIRRLGPQSVPDRIAGYEIVRKVGRGGMGDVYQARQISMDRIVALKITSTTEENHIRRMTREARWIGRLSHPNIIQGLDVGEYNGLFFFAMEYVKGRTLHRLINKEGSLPESRAASLALQIAHATGALWNEHIVHRDIKPGNIMVTSSGVAKLCDLGLAIDVRQEREKSLDQPGMAVGTPFYMSPEQVESKVIADVRSDLYSLGTTLYRMLVGRVPFTGATRAIILSKQLTEPLTWPKRMNPGLSDDICLIIAKLMAKERRRRYQTVDQLIMDLEDFLAGRSPRIASSAAPFWMPQAKLVRDDRAQHNARLVKLRNFARLRQACLATLSEGDGASLRKLSAKLVEFSDEGDAQAHAKAGVLLLSSGDMSAAHQAFERATAMDQHFHLLTEVAPTAACPEGMVYVPHTEFDPLPVRNAAGIEAEPQRASAGPFYIGESSVTNAQYREFIMATNYPVPSHWLEMEWHKETQDAPVTHVSWEDALAYARWCGARLPTALEWELAARGPEKNIYPWGDTFSAERCNTKESGHGGAIPVGTYFGGRSLFGCYDMVGNVWEWTGSSGTGDARLKEARGGSWQERADEATCAARQEREPLEAYADCGFRCLKEVRLRSG